MGCFLCRLPPERQEIKSILASIEEELDISVACLRLLVGKITTLLSSSDPFSCFTPFTCSILGFFKPVKHY